jgi:hypothetical protein
VFYYLYWSIKNTGTNLHTKILIFYNNIKNVTKEKK